MKTLSLLVMMLLMLTSLTCQSAQAEDKVLTFSVKHALQSAIAKQKMLGDVRVYTVGQGHPRVAKRYREYSSNKRSNGVGKSDQDACDIAFVSAMIALQQRADREGGNGVVDIYSVVNNKKNQSSDSYSCLAGRAMVNVILRGTVVRF